jgi:membrane protease YdiL (CAAX protease family)
MANAMTDHAPTSHSPGLRAIWGEYAAFLRRPDHSRPSGLGAPGAWRRVGAMWLLNILGLVVLLLAISGYLKLTGLPGPNAFDEFPKAWLVPTVVLIAPLIEESLFRGWLSGRPRAMWLLAGSLALVGAATLLPAEALIKGAVAIAILLALPIGWFLLRNRQTPAWFARAFPLLFWVTALVFGLVHLSNYPQITPLALPLVLPQIWSGLIFGFLRMRVGLVAGMLVHGASNLLAILPTALGF